MKGGGDLLQIHCPEDCGNAPKKQVLKAFEIAIESADTHFIDECCADDVDWNWVGREVWKGKANVLSRLGQPRTEKAVKLSIEHIITHGNTGSINGQVEYDNDAVYAFCHIVRFNGFGKNAKMKHISSFQIDISRESHACK